MLPDPSTPGKLFSTPTNNLTFAAFGGGSRPSGLGATAAAGQLPPRSPAPAAASPAPGSLLHRTTSAPPVQQLLQAAMGGGGQGQGQGMASPAAGASPYSALMGSPMGE